MASETPPVADHGRKQRRIDVGLLLFVRGKDAAGLDYEDEAHSGNVSRTGCSFQTHREYKPGDEFEIMIPKRPGREEPDYITPARVVRVTPARDGQSWHVGVLFLGPRFHRVFVSENTQIT